MKIMKYVNIPSYSRKKRMLMAGILIMGMCITTAYLFRHFHFYEGIILTKVENRANIQHVIIEPLSEVADYLHLSEFQLYDHNGAKIEYTASSSNGIFNDDKQYNYTALTDSEPSTFFHSGQRACTLKITPKNPSLKISRIFIRNRIIDGICLDNNVDCFQRLRAYKISMINTKFEVFFTKNFSDMENLFVSPFMEEIIFLE